MLNDIAARLNVEVIDLFILGVAAPVVLVFLAILLTVAFVE